MAFSKDEIDYFLNHKIAENYTFYDSNGSEKKLEAFLLQSMLIEGVLAKLLEITFRRRDLNYMKPISRNLSLNETIKDLHLIKVINKREFYMLDTYRKNRNTMIHGLLDKDYKNIEVTSREYYEGGTDILLRMIKKLKHSGY